MSVRVCSARRRRRRWRSPGTGAGWCALRDGDLGFAGELTERVADVEATLTDAEIAVLDEFGGDAPASEAAAASGDPDRRCAGGSVEGDP
ncbi:MAG: hypothetical protein R2695_04115 [Acidimicrobiales bacterium]